MRRGKRPSKIRMPLRGRSDSQRGRGSAACRGACASSALPCWSRRTAPPRIASLAGADGAKACLCLPPVLEAQPKFCSLSYIIISGRLQGGSWGFLNFSLNDRIFILLFDSRAAFLAHKKLITKCAACSIIRRKAQQKIPGLPQARPCFFRRFVLR